jgi:SatD family (SatD)
MISVITGDIINSRKSRPELWLKLLKSELNTFGKSPGYWEIYGGDTFQLLVDNPLKALTAAIRLKAVIKLEKPLDVRLAIGIGDITYKSRKVTECNGPAFIHSGEKFKTLKKEKQKLAVKSDWPDFDTTINICLKLGMIAMDKWSANSAEMVALSLSFPNDSQAELGKTLKINQNAVSRRFSRAHFDELMELNELYKNKLSILL